MSMELTNAFVQKASGILTIKPEVYDTKGYVMFDDGGVEIEVGEFLYGLTRLLKPTDVLTTGIYSGISDMYIAQALRDNNLGTITALEYEQAHLKRAKDLWIRVGVSDRIVPVLTDSLSFTPSGPYQLLFLDTEPSQRFTELVTFFPFLEPGGFVFLHDLHHHLGQESTPDQPPNWPWGALPKEIIEWIHNGELRPWYFTNPRGMTGFQKKKEGDWY